MSFTTTRDGDNAPGFLEGDVGSKLRYACELPIDASLEGTRQAVMARMPGVGTPTALPLIGEDRQIVRGSNEPDASYGARLAMHLDVWAHAGSARAVLGQLLGYASPSQLQMREVNNESAWDTLPVGAQPNDPPIHQREQPGNWNWDGNTTSWWRFWVIVYGGARWVKGPTLGSGRRLGDGRTLGSTMTRDEVDSLRAIIHNMKCKGHWCRWIIVSFLTSLFDPTKPPGDPSLPDGTWGPWSIDIAGVRSAARTFSAIYIDGTPYQIVRGGSGSTIDTIGA